MVDRVTGPVALAGIGLVALVLLGSAGLARAGAQEPAGTQTQSPAARRRLRAAGDSAQGPPRAGRRFRAQRDSVQGPLRARRRGVQPQLAGATSTTAQADAHGVVLSVGAPQQVLKNDQFGMNVPDMHTAVVQGLPFCPQGGAYCLYVTGVIGGVAGRGSTALLTTTNFERGSAYALPAGVSQPVFEAPCRGMHAQLQCRIQFDSGYRGANLVFRGSGGDWVMIYHGETRTFTDAGGASRTFARVPAYAEVGLARSSDGIHWRDTAAIISGTDPKPTLSQVKGLNGLYGTPEPGGIVANGYVYVFFSYNPSPGSPDAKQHDGIEVARASLPSLTATAAGTWLKYYGGSWSQPGLGGRAAAVVPPPSGCNKAGQPFVAYSTYAKVYIMAFMCSQGWYYSTATDLNTQDWSPPRQFFAAPVPEFTPGQPVDENFALVSPGSGTNSIGQTGDVLYAHGSDWGAHPSDRSLWYRPFTIALVTPRPIPQPCPPSPPGMPKQCK